MAAGRRPAAPPGRAVWTLLALTTTIFLVETSTYGTAPAMIPLLEQTLNFSSGSAAVTIAAHQLGAVLGIPPAMYAIRSFGVKPLTLLGLAGLATACAMFGLSDSYAVLIGARFLMGAAGSCCWIAGLVWLIDGVDPGRRGEMLGLAMGGTAAGAIIGPLIGAAAIGVGRAAAMLAFTASSAILAACAAAMPRPAPVRTGNWIPTDRAKARPVLDAAALMAMPGLFSGAMAILVPLRFVDLGAGGVPIAVTFGSAAILQFGLRPLVGRWSDRVGRIKPMLYSLLGISVAIGLSAFAGLPSLTVVCLSAALIAIGVLWAPIVALMADACETAGISQIGGAAAMLCSSAVFALIGTLIAGGVTALLGIVAALVVSACGALLLLLTIRRSRLTTELAPAGADAEKG